MELNEIYNEIKPQIDERLNEFKKVNEYWPEMVFCMCTPQTKAQKGDVAVKLLIERGQLFESTQEEIQQALRDAGVRFHKNKGCYIFENRKIFGGGRESIVFSSDNILDVRNDLVVRVKGWGYKEASHFLRNVGYGDHIAILDRHILRTLVEFGVIEEIPKALDKKKYLEIEQKMIAWANQINIPMSALDLVIWYRTNGEIFK